jgi:mRNA interferase MazF
VILGREDGLAGECAVNLDHLQTVRKARLAGLIVTLPSRRLADVRAALLFALGFTGTR